MHTVEMYILAAYHHFRSDCYQSEVNKNITSQFCNHIITIQVELKILMN